MSGTTGNNKDSMDFYEELQGDHLYEQSYHETIRSLSRYSDTGLREDEVHKLMEDINNPLPSSEQES